MRHQLFVSHLRLIYDKTSAKCLREMFNWCVNVITVRAYKKVSQNHQLCTCFDIEKLVSPRFSAQ